MKQILLLFLAFCGFFPSVCGQDFAILDSLQPLSHGWQEQILQQVDIEELGEAAYGELLEELSELVVWSDTTSHSLRNSRLRQQLVLSGNRCLSSRAGYLDQSEDRKQAGKAYLGDPWHQSIRYRIVAGRHWQAGITLEKDAGEPWRHTFPGYDSWHSFVRMRNVNVNNNVCIAAAVVGHFRLRTGCGLLISQGFSLGKQYLTQQLVSNRSSAITPHSSLTESGFMQGVAADLRIASRLTLLPYFSARQIDGTLNESYVLTALQTDGYHRTHSEAGHRDAAWQIITGARLGWRGEWYDIGLHGTYTQLQYDYRRNANYYNANYFRGHQLSQFSFDYTARFFGGLWRGEWAIDDAKAFALVNALQFEMGSYWKATLLHRYFDTHYRQLHASSVSESSQLQGEQGVLLSVEGQLSRRWQMQGMVDGFWFSQPQYGIRDTTSQGIEGSLRFIYTGSHRSSCPKSGIIGYRIKQKGDYIRHTADASLSLAPTRHINCRTQLRARIYSKVENDPTYGFALSQSVNWQCVQWPSCPFTIEGQACYFNTDDYDSRVYLTERAILYGFGLPMLYGEGLRYSITGTMAIGSRIHLDLKWAMTNYANRANISTGLQQITGNTQQDLWLQIRLKL